MCVRVYCIRLTIINKRAAISSFHTHTFARLCHCTHDARSTISPSRSTVINYYEMCSAAALRRSDCVCLRVITILWLFGPRGRRFRRRTRRTPQHTVTADPELRGSDAKTGSCLPHCYVPTRTSTRVYRSLSIRVKRSKGLLFLQLVLTADGFTQHVRRDV